jgi:hypothetical protein
LPSFRISVSMYLNHPFLSSYTGLCSSYPLVSSNI